MKHCRIVSIATFGALAVWLGASLLPACGGGGNNKPAEPQLLPVARYFPPPLGARLTYRVSNLGPDIIVDDDDTDFTYDIEANPLGAGVFFNLDELEADGLTNGPLFNGQSFSGMAHDAGGNPVLVQLVEDAAQSLILPALLLAVGQEWPFTVNVGAPDVPFASDFEINGTARLAAVEDVTVAGTTYEDSLRIDLDFGQSLDDLLVPGVSASYWLAPDVGPVLGVLRIAGIDVVRADLTSAELP